jgi:hypothetical protein
MNQADYDKAVQRKAMEQLQEQVYKGPEPKPLTAEEEKQINGFFDAVFGKQQRYIHTH